MEISDLIFNVLVLFILMLPGVILKTCKMVPDGFGKGVSNLVLYIAQPALIVSAYLSCEKSLSEIWQDVVWVLILSLIAHTLFSAVALLLFKKAPEHMRKMLRFATIFSNAAFMGIPLVQAIFYDKPEAAIYASIYNITFNLFLWTLGVHICTRESGKDLDGDGDSDVKDELLSAMRHTKASSSLIKLLLHPVTLASLVGVILLATGVNYQFLTDAGLGLVGDVILKLAYLVAPLSMLVLGLRIPDLKPKAALADKFAYLFLFLRHLALPLIVVGIIHLLTLCGLNIGEEVILVTVIMASAPAATSATMFAEKYGCDAAYVSCLIVISTLLCIATMPIVILFV